MKGIILIVLIAYISKSFGMDWQCNQPPPVVNPHLCCKDPKPTDVAFRCSSKMNFPIPSSEGRPSNIRAAACFADCILRESNYLTNNALDMVKVEADIQKKFTDDPDYIPVMIQAFRTCGPIAQQKLIDFQAGQGLLNLVGGCSPFAGLVLGCVYKEFFENCPASKWNSTPQCNAVRDYFHKCTRTGSA